MTLSHLETAVLQHDIHGVSVEADPVCDNCLSPITVAQPVQFDVIRFGDLPNLQRLFPMLTGWLVDALRCGDCASDQIAPATDGFDEALVMVDLVKSHEEYRIDASSLRVVAVSLEDEGYYPPLCSLEMITLMEDLGITRWLRLVWLTDQDDVGDLIREALQEIVEQSREVPPEMGVDPSGPASSNDDE